MGAWRAIRHRLEEAVAGRPLRLRGPTVAREPERGLPDLARCARRTGSSAKCCEPATPRGGAAPRRSTAALASLRPVLARLAR